MPKGAALRASLAECRPGDAVETFTILTTDANDTMRALHHRMPVILSPRAFKPWLAGEDVGIGPAPEDRRAMHRVSRRVNDPPVEDPGCVSALAVAVA